MQKLHIFSFLSYILLSLKKYLLEKATWFNEQLNLGSHFFHMIWNLEVN
jgi:hypothetical protein